MNDLTIPVVTVAAELGVSADKLAAKLGDDVLVDSVGLRVIEHRIARRLLDEHVAAQARARQRTSDRRRRLCEVSERVQATLRGGIVASEGVDPLTALLSVDGLPERVREGETRLDAWLSGRSTAGRYTPTKAT